VIPVLDLRGYTLTGPADVPRELLPRAAADIEHTLDAVRPICEDVRERGVAAVLDITERFDGVRPASTRVPAEVLEKALVDLDPRVRAALEEAARRARIVHSAQRHADAVIELSPGGVVTERWVPVRRVGLYVPGGVVAYPSSVVMNVVPAQVAGVESLAVTSPPQADNDGWPHPVVLAACALCGVATLTRRYVDAVAGTGVAILDTRKTTPGLRALEKYAVRCGGGINHRFGLDDAILIKDNHIAACGGIAPALQRARAAVGHLVRIEIEVDTLAQLDEALAEGVDAVLLDNMTPDQLREAVRRVAGRAVTEASGRITVETVPAIAASGVDLISTGWITHSAPILDLGLDWEG